MGTIFEGVDKNLDDRPVAIKTLHRYAHLADPDALERFRREARAASRVNHPNLAVVYDYGVAPEWGTFIVMELIDGENLAKRLKAVGHLPIHVACQIARQIAYGIGALHRSGFVHRDLKPSNVIITFYDEDECLIQIKVVDFGIVKAISPPASDEVTPTNPGLYVGTPSYMSPEHCANKPLDARSDIYSLGVLLFEMLAGRKPFTCKEGEEVVLLSKHLTEPPPLLREFRPEMPEALERLVDNALSKEPAERPHSAFDFARALRVFNHSDGTSSQSAISTEATDTPGGSLAAREPETQTAVRHLARDEVIAEPEMQRIADHIEKGLLGESLIKKPARSLRIETLGSQATALAVAPADALPTDEVTVPVTFAGEEDAGQGNGAGTGPSTRASVTASPVSNNTASIDGASDTAVLEDSAVGVGVEPNQPKEAMPPLPELDRLESAPRNGGLSDAQNDGRVDEDVIVQTPEKTASLWVEHGESVIQGTVVRTTGEGVVIDFGFSERLIGWDKFALENNEKVIAPSAGQKVEAVVAGTDSPDGFTFLSRLRSLPLLQESPEAIPRTPWPGNEPSPKEQPVSQAKALPEVSDNQVVLTAILAAAVIVTLIAAVAFLLIRWSARPSQPPGQADVPAEVTSTESSVCPTGSECIAAEDSHLRVAPGKFNDQGQENESVGIATKGSLVEVLEADSVRKNWRRVRVIKHGGRKKLMWKEEGWMDGGNLRPGSNP
jgi:serine/threonine-protein kinase